MAIPISSFEDFRAKFAALKDSRDLFAFFLFDSRPSQKAVEQFADQQFDWLDNLAAASRIFFFIFLRSNPTEGRIENPSLEVARMFDIRPNQLPGIVLFALADDREGVGEGVYLPLDASLFENDLPRVEQVFADLFSLIQECRGKTNNPAELFLRLREKVNSLRRREQFRPVAEYLKGTLDSLIKLPTRLIDSVAKAFAEEAARRAAGGIF